MSSASDWKRSRNKYENELHLYLTSCMYDCSLNVGTMDTYQVRTANFPKYTFDLIFDNQLQVFKCHKLILGTASCVFQKMFYGDFKEATLGKDELISLKNVPPAAFDLAMRYFEIT